VNSIEISRTGKFLATNSHGVLRIWKLLDGIRPDSPVVLDCPWTPYVSAFSPEQDLLAVRTGKEVFLWDAEKQTRVWTREVERRIDSCRWDDTLCFSMDGKVIAGESNCTIILWDASSGSEVRRLSGHTKRIRRVLFSPFDPELLPSYSYDETIRIWRTSSETPFKIPWKQSVFGFDIAFSPDWQRQDLLLVAGYNINVWDTTVDVTSSANLFPQATPMDEAGQIEITISPDSSSAASRSDRWVIISDTRDGAIKHKLEMHPTGYLCFSPGRELLMSESRSEIVAWDPSSGDQVLVVEKIEHQVDVQDARGVKHRFSPNGKLLVVASDKALDGRVRLWSLEARDYTVDLDAVARPGFQNAFGFSADSKMLAMATDSDVSIYDTMSGKLFRKLPIQVKEQPVMINFSPDDKLLVAAWSHIGVWDLTQDNLPKTLFFLGENIDALAFSSTGLLAVALSDSIPSILPKDRNKKIQVVNATTLDDVHCIVVDSSSRQIEKMAFSQDGSTLTTNCGSIDIATSSTGIFLRRSGIYRGADMELKIPPDYFPSCCDYRDGMFAIGTSSDGINILEYSSIS
jgi:WD40 repeat protein